MGKLPKSASVATPDDSGKLHAPAAARNTGALSDLLRERAPSKGLALEIASGTGQHIVAFAKALPRLNWQPTEIAGDRRHSIDVHIAESGLPNVRPAVHLDATVPDWHVDFGPRDLVVLINLLHLISTAQAQTIVEEAVACLGLDGQFILYGPFKRKGKLISDGDARFDAQLRGADPAIGYKEADDVVAWLQGAGATQVDRVEMPANNLAIIATR